MSDIPYNPDEEEPKRSRLNRFLDVFPYVGLVFFAALLLMMAGDAININQHLMPKARADVTSDKYDGDCTGHETVGRCADKCPGPTPDGVYYLQGFDKDTGAAVCRIEYYHACPYADSIKAGTPECDKLTEQQQPQTTPVNTTPNTSLTDECGVAK